MYSMQRLRGQAALACLCCQAFRRGLLRNLAGLGLAGVALPWLAGCQQLLASAPAATRTTPTHSAAGTGTIIYRGHAAAVNALAWSPDGRRVASASRDRTAQVWPISSVLQ